MGNGNSCDLRPWGKLHSSLCTPFPPSPCCLHRSSYFKWTILFLSRKQILQTKCFTIGHRGESRLRLRLSRSRWSTWSPHAVHTAGAGPVQFSSRYPTSSPALDCSVFKQHYCQIVTIVPWNWYGPGAVCAAPPPASFSSCCPACVSLLCLPPLSLSLLSRATLPRLPCGQNRLMWRCKVSSALFPPLPNLLRASSCYILLPPPAPSSSPISFHSSSFVCLPYKLN